MPNDAWLWPFLPITACQTPLPNICDDPLELGMAPLPECLQLVASNDVDKQNNKTIAQISYIVVKFL
jgi:hypothetical protein